MKALILLALILGTINFSDRAQAQDNTLLLLQTIQDQKNKWDNMHYEHQKRQQENWIRAQRGALKPTQQRQPTNLQDIECAPFNTYCQGQRNFQLQLQQYNYDY